MLEHCIFYNPRVLKVQIFNSNIRIKVIYIYPSISQHNIKSSIFIYVISIEKFRI